MAEIEKFHSWLIKCNNIYLANTERMDRAFLIISENEKLNPYKKLQT